MFMLPADAARRAEIYRRVLGEGGTLHAAVEGFALSDQADAERWEGVLSTAGICRTLEYREIERWLA